MPRAKGVDKKRTDAIKRKQNKRGQEDYRTAEQTENSENHKRARQETESVNQTLGINY